MSYEVEERHRCWCVVTPPKSAHPNWKLTVASCPTREAAEAARRLLSGECERELAEAQMDRLVAAKTGPGKPMRGGCWSRDYANGKADGVAQERARIVALLKRADWAVAAGIIERGEGE